MAWAERLTRWGCGVAMARGGSSQLGRGRAMLIAAASACALLAACGSQGAKPDGVTNPDAELQVAGGSKSFRGTLSGLETQTWVVNDTTGEVGRALAGYAAGETPAKAEMVRLWRAGGLRIVAVPEVDVEKIRNSLTIVGPLQRRWNGELARWTPLWAGPAWEGARELSIAVGAAMRERESLTMSAGRMRMLARAYAMPMLVGERLESRLRIELVPQHEEPDGSVRALQRQLRGGVDAEQRGMVFGRMALEFVARPGECYMITADAPELEWVSDGERSSDSPGPEMSREGKVDGAPTLGEAMLTDVTRDGTLKARVVLVLVPKVPGTFTLTDR